MSVINDYLQSVRPEERTAIDRVYQLARATVPGTDEGLSYGMAALTYKGKALISVMATKKFLSLYPFSGKVVAKLEKELGGFETTTGSIHFSVEHPLPDALIEKVLSARVAEIEEKVA